MSTTFALIRHTTQQTAARRGTLSVASHSAGPVIETPGCFMYTVKGSVPHLTPDTLRLQNFAGVNVAVEHLWQDHQPASFDKWPFPLSRYLNLEDYILLCDIRDCSKFIKAPINGDQYVSMVCHQGVRQLSLTDYLKTMKTYQVDVLATLTDHISDLEPREKRVKKAIDRTLKWLDILVEEKTKSEKEDLETQQQQQQQDQSKIRTLKKSSLFAHVQGSHYSKERIRSATETAKRSGLAGFIIDTTCIGGNKDQVFEHVQTSLDHLPIEKPKMVYGIQAPEDVLRAVAMGVDLFDTSYPFLLTEDGRASLYSFGGEASTATNESGSASIEPRWIDLWDDEHADKFVPLLEGCECYTCKSGQHTRAYINHLLKAHEMLATVLLMSHNMHQYSKFFTAVRTSLDQGSFEVDRQTFETRFGKEPERTGVPHANQVIVEASLNKRNRLDGPEAGEEGITGTGSVTNGEGSEAGVVAEGSGSEQASPKKDRRLSQQQTGVKHMVNKKERRAQKQAEKEQQQQALLDAAAAAAASSSSTMDQ